MRLNHPLRMSLKMASRRADLHAMLDLALDKALVEGECGELSRVLSYIDVVDEMDKFGGRFEEDATELSLKVRIITEYEAESEVDPREFTAENKTRH